jgi:3-dehydroquinate synthase
MDVQTLITLPERQLRNGLAEVIKMAAVFDEQFFTYLENNVDVILNRVSLIRTRSCRHQ